MVASATDLFFLKNWFIANLIWGLFELYSPLSLFLIWEVTCIGFLMISCVLQCQMPRTTPCFSSILSPSSPETFRLCAQAQFVQIWNFEARKLWAGLSGYFWPEYPVGWNIRSLFGRIIHPHGVSKGRVSGWTAHSSGSSTPDSSRPSFSHHRCLSFPPRRCRPGHWIHPISSQWVLLLSRKLLLQELSSMEEGNTHTL
jgi:hypothetical protein